MVDVWAAERSVATDICVHNSLKALVSQLSGKAKGVERGVLDPAPDRQLPVSGVQANDDPLGIAAQTLQSKRSRGAALGRTDGRRSKHDAFDPALERGLHGREAAKPATKLQRNVDGRDKLCDQPELGWGTASSPIQVDDVQAG